ncbi:MAG: hypothetical protein WAU68_04950 [Vitreimonas sp.]
MTWLDSHRSSEQAAADADLLVRRGDFQGAQQKYLEAALFESEALAHLEQGKPRTASILTVGAAALFFKARDYAQSARKCLDGLANGLLDEFATRELRLLLQAIWTQEAMERAGVSFLPGQITVSVAGGEVAVGAAPLDLIVEKVQTIQSMFYRTIELVRGMPHRSRGAPAKDIREQCRPWLLQAAPGSYQFGVAIREPEQADFFVRGTEPEAIAARFLTILKASAGGEDEVLLDAIPDPEYRPTFLRLSRNLAPTGKSFSRLEVRSAGDIAPITLSPETRSEIGETLARVSPPPADAARGERVRLEGVLRAVHLDKDWLEILTTEGAVKVRGLQDTIDDVIGPMVNKQVEVQASRYRGSLRFIDITANDD